MKVPANYNLEMMKQEFLKYEEARKSGNYNMIMDANQVMADYGIGRANYLYIITNYSTLAEKYL